MLPGSSFSPAAARTGSWAVGTTKRGIGPTYADKAGRYGIRVGDLLYPERLAERLELLVPRRNRDLAFFQAPETSVDELMKLCRGWDDAIRKLDEEERNG